jgi:hypothetical protein
MEAARRALCEHGYPDLTMGGVVDRELSHGEAEEPANGVWERG